MTAPGADYVCSSSPGDMAIALISANSSKLKHSQAIEEHID